MSGDEIGALERLKRFLNKSPRIIREKIQRRFLLSAPVAASRESGPESWQCVPGLPHAWPVEKQAALHNWVSILRFGSISPTKEISPAPCPFREVFGER